MIGEDDALEPPLREWNRYLREFTAAASVADPPADLYCPTEIAIPVRGWDAVGDAQVREFRERGFLVVEDAFTAREVADAVESIGALLGGQVATYRPEPWGRKHGTLIVPPPGRSTDALTPAEQLEWLLLARSMVGHDPRLTRMSTHEKLLGFLQRAMDDAPVMVHNMVRAKPPPVGREKPWHQDLTHFSVHPSATVVSAWIALDDAPLEAGCLHFIPGTHLRGPVGHVYDRDYQIPDPEVSRVGQVGAPVRRGSCVFLNALVHHGSPPNRATGRRLALQLTFKPEHAPMTTDQERIVTFSAYSRRSG